MHEEVRPMVPGAEFYTPEGCFINELSNIEADPEASIARAHVPARATPDGTASSGPGNSFSLVLRRAPRR
jgi:hypothetical protein